MSEKSNHKITNVILMHNLSEGLAVHFTGHLGSKSTDMELE